MITIAIDEIEETQSFEFLVAGRRRITISLNKKNLSVEIPDKVSPLSISSRENSFFLRTQDIE